MIVSVCMFCMCTSLWEAKRSEKSRSAKKERKVERKESAKEKRKRSVGGKARRRKRKQK